MILVQEKNGTIQVKSPYNPAFIAAAKAAGARWNPDEKCWEFEPSRKTNTKSVENLVRSFYPHQAAESSSVPASPSRDIEGTVVAVKLMDGKYGKVRVLTVQSGDGEVSFSLPADLNRWFEANSIKAGDCVFISPRGTRPMEGDRFCKAFLAEGRKADGTEMAPLFPNGHIPGFGV